MNLYPFAGFGFRSVLLEYKAARQAAASPAGIATVIQNGRSVRKFKSSIGYQAGLGFEYVLSRPESPSGAVLFAKAAPTAIQLWQPDGDGRL